MRLPSTSHLRVVIDARPQNADGLLAAEMVLGKSLLKHTLDQAFNLVNPKSRIVILADEEHLPDIRRLLHDCPRESVELMTSPPSSADLILRTDRLYEPRKLRKAVQNSRDPETAILWRLHDPKSVKSADDELLRRRTYQPIGRFWAFPLARNIAGRLVATPIRPNALTLGAGLLMFAAAVLVASTPISPASRLVVAAALAIALVLDTADGHLARLQGTASPFGRWLDNVLDELADVALHGAIAWSSFVSTGQIGWLVLGMVYLSGKYLFVVQSAAGETLDREKGSISRLTIQNGTDSSQPDQGSFRRIVQRTVQGLGHADLRWHFWILLALAGRLEIALVIYAVYFPVRTGMSCLRRGVEHAIS